MSVNFNPDRFEMLTLSEAAINHPKPQVRQRAASLYWLYYGFSESMLSQQNMNSAHSLENWIIDYEEFGIAGLINSHAAVPTQVAVPA